MTADNSPSSTDQAAATKRKQFLGKLIVFGIIIAFALVKPKVDAWLQGNKGQDVVAEQPQQGDAARDPTVEPGRELGTLTLDDVGKSNKPTTQGDNNTRFLETVAPGTVPSSTTASAPTVPKRDTKTQTSPTVARTSQKSSSKRPLPKLSAPQAMPSTSKPTATASNQPGTSSKLDPRANPTKTTNSKPPTKTETAEPRLGTLTLVDKQREVFKSTAGLVYGRGSVDRHRLKHLMKHAKDDLSKPVHGVYASADVAQVTEWVDQAYMKGKEGGKGVRLEEEGDRTVYTVDMGKKIGYVGGEVGKRKGQPACHFLRLVVQDGNEVVTAFPSQSL
jgi:hypothetical protein